MSQQEEKPRRLFRRKPKDPNTTGRLAQMKQVFQLARRHNPASVWLMAAAILGFTALGVVGGYFFGTMWLWVILGLMVGIFLAMFMLGRFAETAAFAEMKGQPGAIGAVLNTARRGWLMDEQPITIDPRTQDLVYRATGKGGVVLFSEGPPNRAAKLLAKEKKRHERVLPNVPIHTFQGGDGADQIPLDRVIRTVHKVPRGLNKAEVLAVRKRLTALGTMTSRPPIPKGIDPMRARPDRRALRGR
ncbi:DUF4191 domain-containing protein [Brevibacterium daeguense]|uniref:DUF4191 domain-containing protein n=1 Tax=Brevibacterium daeguense TaxID=909936 RepID=A0ABP8ENP2_9MICO|nr:DUF4191 domain-containing protein [Brevibacterium daeguense]